MSNEYSTYTGPLIFLHIPKTGGRTLSQVALRQFTTDAVFTIGPPVERSLQEFKALPEHRRAQIRLLEGHMPFGLHADLPQAATYFSLLRDPVDRVVSIYYYILRTPQHYLHARVTAESISFEDFLSAGMTTEIDNGQTRLLSGIGFSVPYGECTPELLKIAKHNIETKFCLAGLTEQFDQVLLVLQRLFGWKNVYYVRRNVSKNRPAKAGLAPEFIRKIEAHHELDLQLYQWVKQRFNERQELRTPAFQRELQRFRWINRVFILAHSPSLEPARNLVKSAMRI